MNKFYIEDKGNLGNQQLKVLKLLWNVGIYNEQKW